MAPGTLDIRNLSKTYPGGPGLDGCSLELHGGEICALLGRRGSGKSTLANCLSGMVRPTSGELLLDDRPLRLRTPGDALAAGIAVVHQELSLVQEFTVAENILISRYCRKGLGGAFIDWARTNEKATALLASLRIDIPATAKVARLTVAQKQQIKLAKAMSYDPSVLVLDEPLAALDRAGADWLWAVLRGCRDRGLAVLFLTHQLDELGDGVDRVAVLRAGRCVGSVPGAQASPGPLVDLMFGASPRGHRPEDLPVSGPVVLEVQHLTSDQHFQDVSFSLRRGEILGLAGVLGAGRSHLLRALAGADPVDSGRILVHGAPVADPRVPVMRRLGLALAPENRPDEGLQASRASQDTPSFGALSGLASLGDLGRRPQTPEAERWLRELQARLAASGAGPKPGGAGKEPDPVPSIVCLDDPGRGLEPQARQRLHQGLWELSRRGLGVVLVDAELDELMAVCHRILVLDRGRVIRETTPEATSLDQLYSLCLGAAGAGAGRLSRF